MCGENHRRHVRAERAKCLVRAGASAGAPVAFVEELSRVKRYQVSCLPNSHTYLLKMKQRARGRSKLSPRAGSFRMTSWRIERLLRYTNGVGGTTRTAVYIRGYTINEGTEMKV